MQSKVQTKPLSYSKKQCEYVFGKILSENSFTLAKGDASWEILHIWHLNYHSWFAEWKIPHWIKFPDNSIMPIKH